MIWIALLIYLYITLTTVKLYRWVHKNRPELSVWNDPHHVNLFWMFVPVVQFIYLIEATEIKLKKQKRGI